MKLFDEQKLVNENITLQNRLDYKYYLLDPMFNYLQELDFLQNVVINRKLNTVSELSFTTPVTLEDGSVNVLNLIRSHYIVQAKSSTHNLYFLVMKQDIRVNKNEKDISFQVLEYPRQLAKDIIHEYEEVSKTITEVTDEILKESSWKVTYIDSDFINKKRSFSFKQQTALESLQNIAQMFNALIEWNVPKKEISFINPNRLRVNRGLVLNSEKYLEGVNLEVNSEEVITRLYLYGKDNLSIEKLTPTGGRYLEDFSWFMKPFEMDEKGNVLQSSNYMTDGLCIGLIKYQQLLKDNNGLFEGYLNELDKLENKAFEIWLDTTELKIDLSIITEELDVLNSTNGSSAEINKVIAQKIAKEKEIAKHEDILENIENDMKRIDEQIQKLNLLLKRENNFTKEQLLELDNFTIQRVYQDTTIEDAKDLLEDGIELFKTINRPTIRASVDITNFYNNPDYKFDWGKLQFGELVTTEIEDLGIDVVAQVTEETYTEDTQTISIVLQNEHSSVFAHENDMTKLLYDSHSSSTTVNMDKYKWDLAEDANDGVSKILNNAWDAAKNQIQGGVEQSVTVSERGLIIRSSENPNHLLIAQNGVLGLSRDNGNTWRTAITSEGVFAETIVGRLIMGNKLIIEDENGIIKLTGDQQVIYDPKGNEKVILGKLDDKGNYGISIKQGALHIEGGLTQDDLSNDLQEKLDEVQQVYTWVKYADDKNGKNMSDNPTGKEYIGLAFNQRNETPSTDPKIYQWSKIQGNDGYTPIKGTDYFDGKDGQDGKSSYMWIRYSQNVDGSNMTTNPTNAKYIGVATTATANAPTQPSAYSWSLIKGQDGIAGETGEDGKTSYLHIKYSNDGKTFTSNNGEDVGAWIGTYVDFIEADSMVFNDYTWNLVKGEDGEENYTWVKYADDDKGAGMSDSPDDKLYIGLAFNKQTSTPSTKPADYEWSLMPQNIEIGGRNFLPKTGINSKTNVFGWANSTSSIIGDTVCFKDGTTRTGGGIAEWSNIPLLENTKYTVSFEASSTDPEFLLNYVYLMHNDGSANRALNISEKLTSKMKKIEHTFKLTAPLSKYRLMISGNGNHLCIKNIKIEKGDVATDWTPAPEDIEKEVSDLNNKVDNNDTKIRGDLRLEAPLPSNIKLDGSGITATSSGDPNKFARLDYRGLYVQGGAIDVRTGTASNRGVIFDGNGIRGYNSSGTKTFEVDTNGNLTANTGTFGGRLNAASGTFTGTLNGVDGTFTGTLRGNNIIGSNITGSTITGSEINVYGSKGHFQVTKAGEITMKSGYVGNRASELEIQSSGLFLQIVDAGNGHYGDLSLSPSEITSSHPLEVSSASSLVVGAGHLVTVQSTEEIALNSGGIISLNTRTVNIDVNRINFSAGIQNTSLDFRNTTWQIYNTILTGNLHSAATEVGFCGVGAYGTTGEKTITGIGVNFRFRREYRPTTVTLTAYSGGKNTDPLTVGLNNDGFWLYIRKPSAEGYYFWRGEYRVV